MWLGHTEEKNNYCIYSKSSVCADRAGQDHRDYNGLLQIIVDHYKGGNSLENIFLTLGYMITAGAFSLSDFSPSWSPPLLLCVSQSLNQPHPPVVQDSHPSPPHHPAPPLRWTRPVVPGYAHNLSPRALSTAVSLRLLLFLLLPVAVVT